MSTQILTHGRVTWTNIVQPAKADIDQLAQRYPQFHPLNLQDTLNALEFPKLDHHDDTLFIVLHLPFFDPQQHLFRPEEVDVFIAKGTLVMVHSGQLADLNEAFRSANSDQNVRAALMERGASPLLYELLKRLVVGLAPLVNKYEPAIHHIEANLFSSDTRHLLNEIAETRRDLIALRHILRPQLPVIKALADGDWPWIHEDLTIYWKDLANSLAQVTAQVEEFVDMIGGLSETVDTLASHRIDEVVRVLTIITVLTLPVNVVSTIFSMNVALPNERDPLTFFVVVGTGVMLTAALVWYLRTRRGL
jgi:magnesium transporter